MTFQNYGLKILYSQTRPKRLLVLETKKSLLQQLGTPYRISSLVLKYLPRRVP
jgi:hypothetical protein